MIRIHDTATDEIIDREMNDQELAVYEAEQASYAAETAAITKAAAEKAALLEKLGITEDEAKLLLG
jgi:hypothetical protein